jgi:crotonobetainyl-CoA:carnitine CoA-transferase CaiB-like acyl-CoA transferase
MQVSMNGGAPEGPLAGVRVLDLSNVVSGPFCTQALGDLGADVVKVEAPGGDTTRRMGIPDASGFTGFYLQFNRNKQGISVDLKSEDGRDVVRRLARDADVVVENYRPGVADRLGIGYEALSADNRGLVYVSINGFGPDGPYRDLPAYDSVIQGLGGFMPTQGGDGEPTLVRSIAADKASGMTAIYAVLAALFARERNGGEGQKVEVPMLDSWIAYIQPDILQNRTYAKQAEPLPAPEIHRTWATRDGHVVMMIIEDHQFHALCRALDREDMIDDPRCGSLLARYANLDGLFGELAKELRKYTTQEFVERAREHGAPVAPAKIVFEVEHPDEGPIRFVRNPVRFASTPASMRSHPPKQGEHTDGVLRKAGYSDEEIATLRASGAVR